jgi:predicted SAM-dependent methyltransferase
MNSAFYDEMRTYNSLHQRLKFELISLIGRIFFRYRGVIKKGTQPLLLDIGVGNNFTKGWTHVDFYRIPLNPLHWIKNIWNKPENRPEIELDLRYPLHCKDAICDGIYCSHTIEHFLPDDAIRLIREFYRILKPSAYARIIVPDFGTAMKRYINQAYPPGRTAGCEVIMGYTQTWGHLSTWDEEFLTQVLTEAGFVNIQVVEFGVGGRDQRLVKEESSRKEESIVIEAQKPDTMHQNIIQGRVEYAANNERMN